jgi:hypothetical protein
MRSGRSGLDMRCVDRGEPAMVPTIQLRLCTFGAKRQAQRAIWAAFVHFRCKTLISGCSGGHFEGA